MPNTFGSTGQQVPLYDPRLERAQRARFRRDEIPELRLANALYVPAGRWSVSGWVLLRRADYDLIDPYDTALSLTLDALTFDSLTVVQARCVSRGMASDPDAVYLVELTDARGVLENRWFSLATPDFYNVRDPAYPEQYYETTNYQISTYVEGEGYTLSTVPYTWDQITGNLWQQMPSLRTYPGLPFTPTQTAEGFSFGGHPAWASLNDVLDLLGCQVTCDLTQENPYGIALLTVDDPELAARQALYAGLLEDDWEYLDAGAGRIPGSYVVFFHRRNEYYGTEETVRKDALQWQSRPFYSVTVPGPAQYADAPGQGHLWVEYTVRFDVDGNPLAADVATANVIAVERVAEVYGRITRAYQGYLRQVYAGALPFVAGGGLDGVCWRMDFREGQRAGWRTEIVRGPQPPWKVLDRPEASW